MAEQRDSRPKRGHEQAWMVTFTDLLALILSFFVLLFAMSQIKMESWESFVEALTDRLNPNEEWQEPALLLERQAQRIMLARAVNLDYLQAILSEKMQADALMIDAHISRLDDRLVVSLPGDLVFEAAGWVPGAKARTSVMRLGDALQFVSNQVDVVGYDRPRAGETAESQTKTWEVSLRRAMSIAEMIVSGGYAEEVRAVSMGSARYYELDPGLGERMRRRLGNRVDIVIRDSPARGGEDGR